MKTSGMLPEECKAEIRTDIMTTTYSTKALRSKGLNPMIFGAGWEAALKWVLNDKEG